MACTMSRASTNLLGSLLLPAECTVIFMLHTIAELKVAVYAYHSIAVQAAISLPPTAVQAKADLRFVLMPPS